MVLKRLPYAFVLASLMITCSKKDSDKSPDPVTTPPETQACQGLAEGETKVVSAFKKARASWNESCSSLALQMSGTCTQGQLLLQGEGSPLCEETILKKLSIKSASNRVEVDGAPLLLTLEGTDQDGQSFTIDSSAAAWTSSDARLSVSSDGHVTAQDSAADVVIKASLRDLSAEWKVIAEYKTPENPRKNCEDTSDGATKEFPRFRQALVNFQSVCEPYQATAVCDDGQFIFKQEDSITECRVAAVKEFTVTPQALTILGGDSRPLTAEAVDETAFKGTVNFSEVSWSIEASAADQGKITVADGTLALTADLLEDAQVKAQYREFTQTISLAKAKIEPTRISFEKGAYLLKSGDTLDLKVLAFAADKPIEVDPSQIVFESSDPAQIFIENSTARVLVPGASVTLTAKYADGRLSAETRLTSEAELKLIQASSKKDILIAEKPWVVAVSELTLEGPALEEIPQLLSQDKSCAFAIYLSRGLWTVDVQLQTAAQQTIPANCQAEVSVTSAAGQKVVQTLNVPVRYVALTFKEYRLQDPTQAGQLIASLSYQLSSNVTIRNPAVSAHTNSDLTPPSCKLATQQKEGVIEVTADVSAAPGSFCAGFLSFEVDTDGKKQIMREQVTVSSFRPFSETCADQGNQPIQKTIKAISDALSIRRDCALIDTLLRKKNSESIFRNAGFTLSLASHELTNLEPLAHLTGLRELILSDNDELVDIRPLASLKSLTRLDLDFTGVTDFSPLYRLNAMKLFYSDLEKIDCKKSEVTNKPLQNLCTQE